MGGARIVAVVGATATGKTEVGEILADALGGEVVCADSRQVFRQLEIGTGKPTPADLAARSHHLFAALGLGQRPSAGWYARAAGAACADILARGRVPVLVGGSGLWLHAAQHGLSEEPPHDAGVRAHLQEECARVGVEALHARLALVDPATASRLQPRDRQRVLRALEVHEASGRPLSAWHAQQGRPAVAGQWCTFELVVPPETLEGRIARRTQWMLEAGLVEETRGLLEAGLATPLRGLRAVGYDEALEVLAGRLSRHEAAAQINLRTRRLAKRQRTWFRHQVAATRLDGAGLDARALVTAIRRVLAG